MTKLIHIISDSNIGGAGRCLVNYLRCHDRSRFAVSVILPRGSLLIPQITALDVPVIEVDGIAERSFSPAAVRELSRILKKEKPRIVHTHGSFSGRIAAKLCGSRIVYTRHSAFPISPRLQKGIGHHLNGLVNGFFADIVIAVSPAAQENLMESGIAPGIIRLVGNGVAPLSPADETHLAALRSAWEIPDGCFVAGYPARLEDYKGHDLLLEAAKRLKAEGREFRILIAGRGNREQKLWEQANAMGVSDRVQFPGFVEDMAGFLSLLTVQLNCSTQSEACSMSIIEGMSLGLPTIASRCSGNPWLVEDGVTGLLFENNSAEALTAALKKLMDDPALVQNMGNAARAAYEARFTGRIFAANLERVYDEILKKKGGSSR
jgi:glycosyltransferase involved in cell wall biosynthesis